MYISIDIETTGLDTQKDQVIEFAAVLWKDDGPITDQPFLDLIVSHERYVGNAVALSMNSRIFKILAEERDPRIIKAPYLHQAFQCFLAENGVNKFQVIGKNFSSFDMPFLKRLGLNFSHRVLDVGALYATRNGVPSSTEIPGFGVPGAPHEALHDARWALEAARQRFWSLEDLLK